MKKIILILVVISQFLVVSHVVATNISQSTDYLKNYEIKWDGYIRNKAFNKMTDENGVLYFDVTPQNEFNDSMEYQLGKVAIPSDVLENITKIIYAGFKGKGFDVDQRYFATQYLIYNAFSDYTVAITDNQNGVSNDLDTEIASVQEALSKYAFSFENIEISDTVYTIKNQYIADHFTARGDHVEISYFADEINFKFLDDQASYVIDFIPNWECSEVEFYTNDSSVGLLGANQKCANPHSISVVSTLHMDNELEENPSKDKENNNENDNSDNKLDNNDNENNNLDNKNDNSTEEEKKEIDASINEDDKNQNFNNENLGIDSSDNNQENIDENSSDSENKVADTEIEEALEFMEVKVPNTFKNSIDWLVLFLLAGNIYYVCKK